MSFHKRFDVGFFDCKATTFCLSISVPCVPIFRAGKRGRLRSFGAICAVLACVAYICFFIGSAQSLAWLKNVYNQFLKNENAIEIAIKAGKNNAKLENNNRTSGNTTKFGSYKVLYDKIMADKVLPDEENPFPLQAVIFFVPTLVFFVACAIAVARMRYKVRQQRSIEGSHGGDYLVSVFCFPCVVSELDGQLEFEINGSKVTEITK